MKTYLSLIAAAALALSACGQETPQQPAEQTPPAAASQESAPSAPASDVSAAPAAPATANVAEECKAVITGDDAMKFEPKEINIKSSCTDFAVVLKHTGKMPKAAMGHNVVISKAADKDAVLKDGAEAGVDKDYLKPNDERVVAATKMIGGGEEDTVVFAASKLAKGEDYAFYCTFPGHSAMMSGTVKLVD